MDSVLILNVLQWRWSTELHLVLYFVKFTNYTSKLCMTNQWVVFETHVHLCKLIYFDPDLYWLIKFYMDDKIFAQVCLLWALRWLNFGWPLLTPKQIHCSHYFIYTVYRVYTCNTVISAHNENNVA